MYWRGIIVGLALGLWIALVALWILRSDDDAAPPACPTVCCGGCGQSSHPHQPPVNIVWDGGGGFNWHADLSEQGPVPGSPTVPVPAFEYELEEELGRERNPFEFRCTSGAGGIDDVAVMRENIAVSIVMPNGNVGFECAVSADGGAEIKARVNTASGPTSPDRAYCMVVKNPDDEFVIREFIDTDWAP